MREKTVICSTTVHFKNILDKSSSKKAFIQIFITLAHSYLKCLSYSPAHILEIH